MGDKRRKKKSTAKEPKTVVWNDDFNLYSFGVEAPVRDRLKSLTDSGMKPEPVNDDIRARYVTYLETMKTTE